MRTSRTLLTTSSALAALLLLAGCTNTDTPAADAAHNDADVMFAAMMIPHHEQAIEMSDLVLNAGEIDPAVATLAQQIKDAQGPEIETLRGWLEEWGAAPAGDVMEGMDHGDGMMSDTDMDALEAAGDDEVTRLYLEQMIVHHEGAIDMAEAELSEGRFPAALEMARTIIDTQTGEIATMRDLLDPLASYGLGGLTIKEAIDQLESTPLEGRSTALIASVRPHEVLFTGADGDERSVPLGEEFYLSFAPYVDQTHECYFHSLTTCRGELRNTEMTVTLTSSDGKVIVDDVLTSNDNGFIGLWLPRNAEGTLSVEYDGKSVVSDVSTGDDDPTCLTDLRLS